MWWGGNPKDEDDTNQVHVVEPEKDMESEGSDSPPVDLMADEEEEDANKTLGASDDEISDEDDFGDFQEKFAAQEKLLGELRGVLKSNEDKLETKSKVVKEYAARLFSKPHFYGASHLARSSSTPVVVPRHDESQEIEDSGFRMSKLKMLKKELDDQRTRETEELKQQRNLEVMVRQLQMEIAERDRMISTLREDQYSVASLSFAGSPANSPFVMSPDRGGSPSDLSPNRSPPLGCSLDSSASFGGYSIRSMADSRYLEMSEKNIELERRILDLEESLREKDELIKARTQAVHLMSADLSAKGKSTIDQLEETRLEMKNMQSNFAEKEAEWRLQMSILKTELVSKDKKVEALHESLEKLDRVRTDLASKQGELHEKIKTLQNEIDDGKVRERKLVDEKSRVEEESSRKINLLEQRLEIADGSQKIRQEKFIEELRTCISDSAFSNKLVELENQISELEEEKGNLQLKLVESEEISAQEIKAKESLKLLRDECHQKEDTICDLNRKMQNMETEKQDFLKSFEQLREELHKSELKLLDSQSSCDDLSTVNVRLEMRAIVLEEERDRMKAEIVEVETFVKNVKQELQDHLKQHSDLKEEHSNLVLEYHRLEELHSRCQSSQKLFDKDFVDKSNRIKELTISMNHLETVLDKKNSEIAEILVQEGLRREEFESMSKLISSLELDVSSKNDEITVLRAYLDESSMATQLQELNEKIMELNGFLERATDRAARSEEEAIQLKEALVQAQVEEAKIREELRILLCQNEENILEKGSLESENRLLSQQVAEERANALKAHDLMKELQERVRDLEAIVESASLEKTSLKSSYDQILIDHEKQNEALSDYKVKYSKLVKEHSVLEEKISEDSSAIEELKASLVAKAKEAEVEKNNKESLASQIQDLEKVLEERGLFISQLETEQQESIRATRDQTNEELKELKKALDMQNKDIEEYQKAIESLKLEVEQSNSEVIKMKNVEQEIEKLVNENEKLNAALTDMKKYSNTFETSENLDETMESDVYQNLHRVELQNQELKNSIAEYEGRLLLKEDQIKQQENASSKVFELEQEIRVLRDELMKVSGEKSSEEEALDKPSFSTEGWDDGFSLEPVKASNIGDKEKLVSLKSSLVSTRQELNQLKNFVQEYEQEGVQQIQQMAKLLQNVIGIQPKEEIEHQQDQPKTLAQPSLFTLAPTDEPEEEGDGWDEDFGGFGDELSDNQDDKIDDTENAAGITSGQLLEEINHHKELNASYTNAFSRLAERIHSMSPDDFPPDTSKEPIQFVEKVENFVSSLQDRYLEVSNLLEISSEEVKKLQEKLESDQKLIVQLAEARENLTSDQVALTEELNSQITELKSVISKHEAASSAQKEILTKQEDRLKLLESSYNELVSNKPEDIQALVIDRDKQKAKIDLLTKKCKTLIVKCKELEEKFAKKEDELNTSSSFVESLTKLVEERNEALAKFDSQDSQELSEMKERLLEYEEMLAESENKVQQLSITIDSLKIEADKIGIEKSSSDAEIERLSNQLSILGTIAEEDKRKLEDELARNETICQSLITNEQEIASLKIENENLMSEVALLRKESESKVEHQSRQLSDEFERLCMEMSNKIDELLNVHKKFGVSIESFESSLGEINKLNFTYLSIATSVREAFNQTKVDEQICEDLEKMISALETDRFSLLCNSTSVEALTNKLEVLRTEVQEHQRQVIGLTDKMSSIERNQVELLEERNNQIETARRSIEDLENRLAESDARVQQALGAERPLDIAEFNRPPPDVTQYQAMQLHPDVAHYPTASVQPDLMPQNNFQVNPDINPPFDWNDAEGGWGDDEWGVEVDDQPQHYSPEQDIPQGDIPNLHVENYFIDQPENDVFDVAPHHLADPMEDVTLLRNQIKQQSDEIVSLRGRLDHEDQEIQVLNTKLAALCRLISSMHVEFNPSLQMDEPEALLQHYCDELLTLRNVSRVSDHQRLEIESLRDELSKWIDAITLLRREQAAKDELLQGNAETIQSLNQQLLEKTDACGILQKDIVITKTTLEEKSLECETLLTETYHLRKQLEDTSKSFDELSLQFNTLQQSYEVKSSDFDSLLSKYDSVQKSFSEKHQEVEELLSRINVHQTALENKPVECHDWLSEKSLERETVSVIPQKESLFTSEAFQGSSDCVDSKATPFFSWNDNPFGATGKEADFDIFAQPGEQTGHFQQVHEEESPHDHQFVSVELLNQQIFQLQESLKVQEQQLGNENERLSEEISKLKNLLESTEAQNKALENELLTRPEVADFEQIKGEISLLLEQVQTGSNEIFLLQKRIFELEESNRILEEINFNQKKEVEELLKARNDVDRDAGFKQEIKDEDPTPSAPQTETLFHPIDSQETLIVDNVSSYFQPASQLFGSSDASCEFEVSTVEPQTTSSFVEAHQESALHAIDDQTVEWYKAELTRYQQAINDWYSWAEANAAEMATLQSNLSQCTEAYNTVTSELATLKESQSIRTSEEDLERLKTEVSRLKALLQSRQIEIDDLIETVDRLKFEKEDLNEDFQMLEAKFKDAENFEKRQEDQNFQLLYEELKTEYDAIIDQNSKLSLGSEVSKGELNHQLHDLQTRCDEAELRAQKAEVSLQEAQQQIGQLSYLRDNLLAEKVRLSERIDTLEEGNEKFFEMKEKQDQEIEMLRTFESDWKRRHDALQWQVTEMEQQMETQKTNLLKSDREQELLNKVAKLQEEVTNTMGQNLVLKNNQDAFYKENASLKMEVLGMKHSVNEMEQACEMLKEQLRDAGVLCTNMTQEKAKITSEFADLLEKFETAQSGLELMQNIIVQRDQLAARCQELQAQVLDLEQQQSEMSLKVETRDNVRSSPSKDYAEFQNINIKLQTEIQSLRSYIDDQQHVIAELQQTPFGHSSSQDLIIQLQKQIQEKTEQIIKLQGDNESLQRGLDEREREEEIRKLLTTSNEGSDYLLEQNLSLENDRLKNDLNQSARENRQLSQQLEAWKKQLASFSASSPDSYSGSDFDNEDFDNSPVMLRMRQEQAYRSVTALQLRVEELTLEVTKLLEERDTLQIKLSNVMRQFERHKESASRASTARSTPVPWMPFVDYASENRDLRQKLDELGKLNYALDIELQKERETRQLMQSRLTGSPRRIIERSRNESSNQEVTSPGSVIHL